ncbi:phage portal protein [Falsirhodobacter halotolerans]|uniref:phage portal protein n=1 Tax=Falsirhodobacter halotolerans TaxID=1146892 RepID=UPI001FD03C19|nr:phage portal protein [Falsirhodobacter halotolerans]MCJ8139363.1 phage portal protein [Falsirhodobacter halotolerans]
MMRYPVPFPIPNAVSDADILALQVRKIAVEDVARVFGVSPKEVGIPMVKE